MPRSFPCVSRAALVVAAAVALALPSAQAAGAAPAARASAAGLGSAVGRALAGLGHSSVAGYAVVEGLGVVVDRRAGTRQPPASTEKLFTTGAALLTLGPSYVFPTTVGRTGTGTGPSTGTGTAPADDSGTLHGDLVLRGGGDPTLTSADLDRLAASVAAAGVRRVTGRVWLDDTLFDGQRGARGWHADYVGSESGPLSALMVDHNLWRRGADVRADPAPSNLALFRADLLRHKVAVAGPSRVGQPGPVTGVVATHTSARLDHILTDMDRRSDNTYAEMVLKAVGAAGAGSGSTLSGAHVVVTTAAAMGVTLGRVVDGSGLSTLDAESAQAEVAYLQAMDATPVAQAFRRTLPVSCSTGTLAGRLCGVASHRVSAKTGTLDHTANLAGFTSTLSGQRVWFAFLVDRTSLGPARDAIDRAVATLATSAP